MFTARRPRAIFCQQFRPKAPHPPLYRGNFWRLKTVFGGMYFYHSIYDFMPMPNAAFGSSFPSGEPTLAILVTAPFNGAAPIIAQKVRVAGRPRLWFGRGGGSGHGFGRVLHLVCFALRIVCLPGLLLCACFWLSLPLLGLFIFWLKAPCFGSLFVPAVGTALPLGLGDLNNLFLLVGLGLFILSRNSVSNPFAGYQP